MNFECHITLDLANRDIGEQVATEFGWSTSEIERDPILGKASYFYLTAHDYEYGHLYQRMKDTVKECTERGAKVVREKIELIIHDKRSLPSKEGHV